MWVVSTEDKTVASTWGATIHLKAGEPRQVGDDFGLLCLQQGCTEVKKGDEPVVEEVVEEAVEEVVEESSPDFNSMTKVQLEEYGRTIGIELDRRKKKSALIEELEAASS
jgi:hypothetical protein|tara:strand:+ start:85 stop:414 length:330 start_codon:yes stop_codon:yes gene_type:complete